MRSFLALTLAVVASMFIAACGGGQPAAPTPTTAPVATPTTPSQPSPATTPDTGNGDRVEVSLEDPGGSGAYIFAPSEFNFTVGQTVTFVLTSETEFHTFTVDDLGIDVEVDAGETQELTFMFDKPGEFALICIPHEALGMTGTITVQ